jgi:hypothetical protein
MNPSHAVYQPVLGLVFLLSATVNGWTGDSVYIKNASFELPGSPVGEPAPTDWTFFNNGPNTSGVIVSGEVARTGSQVLMFFHPTNDVDVGTYQGYYQSHSVVFYKNEPLAFEAYMILDSNLPTRTGVTAKIGIEFYNGGTELNRKERILTPSLELSTSSWTRVSVSASPTNTANEVRLTISQSKNSTTSDSGIFMVDDARARYLAPSRIGSIISGSRKFARK